MSLKKSLFKNSLASILSKVSLLSIRLVQVPLFITTLGVVDYGHWIVLSSLPSWLAISNLGFGSVAANEISMSVAAGDFKAANRTYSTTVFVISLVTLIGATLITSIVLCLPNIYFPSSASSNVSEVKWTIILLSLSVFISFLADVFGGRLRAVNKAHKFLLLGAIKPWIDLLFFLIVLQISKRFDYLALTSLMSIIIYTVFIGVYSRGRITNVFFSVSNIRRDCINKLFTKGVAFQAFPLGNAILFQGNILVIQSVLGPVAVVLFSTARTLVRSVNQLMEMVNQTVWPEFTLLFGKQDFESLRRLHRVSVLISVFGSLMSVIVLAIIGVPLYQLWTGKAIALNYNLLLLFLLPIPFNALWYTSSVVHAACNKHEPLALRYLYSCSISLISCFFLSKYFGVKGAALSTILADLLLIRFVFNRSLKLTDDTIPNFFSGLSSSLNTIVSEIKNRFQFFIH